MYYGAVRSKYALFFQLRRILTSDRRDRNRTLRRRTHAYPLDLDGKGARIKSEMMP